MGFPDVRAENGPKQSAWSGLESALSGEKARRRFAAKRLILEERTVSGTEANAAQAITVRPWFGARPHRRGVSDCSQRR